MTVAIFACCRKQATPRPRILVNRANEKVETQFTSIARDAASAR